MPITFTIPGNPVPQPRPRFTTRGKFGKAYTPSRHPVNAYRRAIAAAAVEAGAGVHEQPVQCVIDAVFARPKSHARMKTPPALPVADCDNIAKAVQDALNGVAWKDDRQVGRLVVEKSYGPEGRTTVRIS